MSTEAPQAISFSDAYDELKSITDQLNADQVEVDALVPLLRRGKGLERALRAHLERVEQDVEAIEAGEGIARYEIVATAAAETPDIKVTKPAPAAEDDIPF